MHNFSNEAVIETLELTRYYNSHPAVDALSLRVPKGVIFGLLGPNGAGKSTTIKMLTTLLPPTSGTALVYHQDIIQSPALVRQHIGYVPQMLSADGDLTGYENLSLSAKLYGLFKKERELRVNEILQFMGLTDFKNQLVNQYSGGMIRRLEIGQALLHNPRVLFLDEPTVGLDPSARKLLWQYIQAWQKKNDMTILITTHDMDEADKLCDIVAFMYQGRIVAIDRPSVLKKSLGPKATLDNVFIHLTGTSVKEGGNYQNVKEVRRTISRLE